VRKHKHGHLAGLGVDLLKHSQYEDSCLAHATLGLAHDIHPQDRLRNTLVLHFGRMLEATINDRAQQLGLEEEILEARRVDGHICFPSTAERWRLEYDGVLNCISRWNSRRSDRRRK
jgi:hypothetical protein